MSTEATTAENLAERRLLADLGDAPVRAGELRRMWRIGRLEWPHLYVEIETATATYAAGSIWLRIDVSGYPQAPTSTPWDPVSATQLGEGNRPSGGRAGQTFRCDWGGGAALYIPLDRVALSDHPGWPQNYRVWDPELGIVQLLSLLHEILNEADHADALDAA